MTDEALRWEMKFSKAVSLFLMVSFLISFLPVSIDQLAKAEEKNPLKIEKIIGLSKIPGTFRNAHGVAVAKDGTIFIADTSESQIEVYDSNYKYVSSFGSIGSGDGQFQDLEKIFFDQDEILYTLDSFLCRVQVFTKEGKFIRKFGEKGEKPEQLSQPVDFNILKSGEIIINDAWKGVKVFSKEGKFDRIFFKDIKYKTKFWFPYMVVVDKYGSVYIFSLNIDTFEFGFLKCKEDGTFLCNFLMEGKEEKHINLYVTGATTDDNFFYISDGLTIKKYAILVDAKKSLQFVETFLKGSDDVKNKTSIIDPSFLLSFNQKIYYLDSSLNRLIVLNSDKELIGFIESGVKEDGDLYPKNEIPKDFLSFPRGITIGPDNNFYVVNANLYKVSVFDSTWKEIKSFGKPITSKLKSLGELYIPRDLVFDQQGFCYVSDDSYSNRNVEIFTKDMVPYKSIYFPDGSPGGLAINSLGNLAVGKNGFPNTIETFDINKIAKSKITKKKSLTLNGENLSDLLVDDHDNMIVSFMDSNEVHWIDPDGKLIQKIGKRGDSNSEESIIKNPCGLLLDGASNLYVTEPLNERIKKFSPEGNLIWESDLNWYGLSFLTMDSQGKIYATDPFHNLILVLSDETAIPPIPKDPKPLQSEADFSLTINNKSITEDDTFTVFVNANHLEKCSYLSLTIRYPEDLTAFQSYQLDELFKGTDFEVIDSSVDSGMLSLTLESRENIEINSSGTLFSIQFAANKSGSGKISLEKIEIKNSINKEVLYKIKSDLNFTIIEKDTTPPRIILKSIPEIVYESSITIEGETEPEALVKVNAKALSINPDGSFSVIFDLQKGINTIIFTSTDKAGNKSETVLTITYIERIIIKLVVGSREISIKGELGLLDSEPFIDKISGRTMVPLRAIAEAIGATVNFDPKEQRIEIKKDSVSIYLWIGKSTSVVNGTEVSIDPQKPVSPMIVKGRTFLPLRFNAESFDFKVDWDPKTQSITLTYPNPEKGVKS